MKYINFLRPTREKATTSHDEGARPQRPYDDSPVPRLTIHSFIMGVFVSMGGFIFGYDTGQISGFLVCEHRDLSRFIALINISQAMPEFLSRFGQMASDGTFYFSNVRSGLIVAMLSVGTLMGALGGGPVADLIGRKWSISAWCLMLHLGLIVQISSPPGKWYQSRLSSCFLYSFKAGANRVCQSSLVDGLLAWVSAHSLCWCQCTRVRAHPAKFEGL
jgi:SP family sugar:H+ symporter-like MFS transporter